MPLKARLNIETQLREGKTILTRSFASQPFKLANITEDNTEACLQLMLMNSSPGVLDGDEYYTEIVIGENSVLQLYTQSYQRLFTMQTGACQKVDVQMSTGSSMTFFAASNCSS